MAGQATGSGGDAVDPAGGADWVDVGGLADLRDNRLVVELDGASIVVVRAGRSIVAVENECPHLGSRLSDGKVRGRAIRCAAHGYRWDLTTGKSLQGPRGPRRRPLRAIPVRLDGDRILLARSRGSSLARVVVSGEKPGRWSRGRPVRSRARRAGRRAAGVPSGG